MSKHFLQQILKSYLLCSLVLASTAGASTLQLTFSGSYYAPVLDPATGCCFNYVNLNGTLPFAEPADGTAVVATLSIDPNQVGDAPANFFKEYVVDEATLSFGSHSFASAAGGDLAIFNDSPPIFPPTFPHFDESPDVWLLTATLDNGDYMDIVLIEPADQAPADALTSSDFAIPDVSQFSFALMQYRTLTGDFVAVEISSVDAQVIPVPAAFWLFGSALLGLLGLGRFRHTACINRTTS